MVAPTRKDLRTTKRTTTNPPLIADGAAHRTQSNSPSSVETSPPVTPSQSRQAARAQRERMRVGEEKAADPGPGVSRRNPLSRYVRGRGRRETGLK